MSVKAKSDPASWARATTRPHGGVPCVTCANPRAPWMGALEEIAGVVSRGEGTPGKRQIHEYLKANFGYRGNYDGFRNCWSHHRGSKYAVEK